MKFKKIAAVLAVVWSIFLISACQSDSTANLKDLTVGQNDVQFGPYLWTVLELQDDRAMLMTTDIVEKATYNDEYASITWEDCTLRAYLNGEFLENNFTDEEREQIIEVTNTNIDNVWFGTEGGNDTQDKVFILSIEEALSYFGDISTLDVDNDDELNYIIDDEYNDKRIARYEDENTWWWLRSPGNSSKFAATVTHKGILEVGGYFVQSEFGIRPVIWVQIPQD